MNNTAVIIPSRLKAERLPNKPLKLINKKEMILHVYETAIKAKIGEVFVATPDREIADIIKNYGGKAIITDKNHQTGTDRIYEVFKKELKSEPEFLVNLQGDMPNLNPLAIHNLIEHMKKKTCDIGTLASKLSNLELNDPNVVKVMTNKNIEKEKEFSSALDFFRTSKNNGISSVYHHIGIYAFTNKALIRYVSLKRSKLEIERKLEQLRALENQMKIEVGYIEDCPLSVDTEKDLEEIKKIMQIK
jgi:3-deoxy-manno-octulosonate cytidylyltransferase (CMP-KDO synthetase)